MKYTEKLLYILTILIQAVSFGQVNEEGSVCYTEYFGEHEKVKYTLFFNTTFSFYEEEDSNDEEIEIINGFKEPKIKREYYTNLKSKEILFIEGIAYKPILAKDTIAIQWQIHEETKIIGGFMCLKATTNFKNNNYTAWFTTDIPVPFGPWKFNNLPGLILECKDDSNFYQITADKIIINSNVDLLEKKLKEIKKSKPISMEKYKELRNREDEDIYNMLISKSGRETYLKVSTDYTGFLREPIK